jgi:hypothetical protein
VVAGELVDEHQREAVARHLEVELDAVRCWRPQVERLQPMM